MSWWLLIDARPHHPLLPAALETAAEALMHGESAFAAPSIKAEPGVSSGVMMVGQGPSSLAVQ
jgi:hypothetical protein